MSTERLVDTTYCFIKGTLPYQQGRAAAAHVTQKRRVGEIVETVVIATVEAAVSAIIRAAKDTCLAAVKEEVDPKLPPQTNNERDNLRITGITEESRREYLRISWQTKFVKWPCRQGCGLNKGVDISSCYPLG